LELILERVNVRQGGDTWLADVDLQLSSGMTILLGPSNAGKTTLMRVVAGLLPPTSGRVLVNGKDVTEISVRKRSVAFVYQQFINYPSLTVYDNIASPLRLAKGFPKARIDRRVREVAEGLGIDGLLDRRPGELSGGQQQRTAIARALAKPVDVLLLDEPLANLDYKLREQMRADLKGMFHESDRVVLYSTAEPNEALTFAARTVVLGEGRVRHVGDPAKAYAHPPTLEVAATLSDPPLNLLPGREPGVTLGIRPHQVTIERTGSPDRASRSRPLGPRRSEQLMFPAEIRLAEVTGSATYLHLVVDGGRHLVAELPGTRLFTPGEQVVAYVDPANVLAFDEASGRRLAEAAGPGLEVDLRG
jgi:glycerol transport system ATP-binding protein